MTGDLRLLEHRDPTCTAGFSVTLDARVPMIPTWDGRRDWDDRRPTRVLVRCWSCDTEHVLSASTLQLDRAEDVEGDPSRAAAEDRAYMSGGDYPGSLRTLAAAVPVERVGRVQLHAEKRTGWGSALSTDDVYVWLVTDPAGNVLGLVERYHGQRGGVLFRCGLVDGAGRIGEGYKSRQAAAKVVVAAALRPLREPAHA